MSGEAKPILVVGGGIAGMTAAVEAAEVGYRVILVEKDASLGGRVMRSYKYFPKMCPPSCGFEVNTRRIRRNPRITVHTLSTVERVSGKAGAFTVTIRQRPRYVTGERSLDDSLAAQLTSECPDDLNLGMGTTKALYFPHDMAYPPLHMLDRESLSESDVQTLTELAPAGAIDLAMPEETFEVDIGAIIIATGWRPYDATKLDTLGFGRYANVVTNVMMERLADPRGPTGGKILRPSDGQSARNVAFVQCAGSRDENHLPYCSSVCCMASLKQARYLRTSDGDARATVFYIDIRTIGRLESFYYTLLEDSNVAFVKGKVAKISEDPDSRDLILDVEDTIAGGKPERRFDLVVLATGIVPNTADARIPCELEYDEHGFIDGATNEAGIYAAGCATHPCDVSRATKESTAAALKAIQCVNRG